MTVALEKSKSGPRELFSVSQIEKAFGPGYEQGTGCLRSWGERYLEGWREPELTYEQALALPDSTPEQKKVRSSYIAKTFGKALEKQADLYLSGKQVDFSSEPGKRLFPGLHLLPHPSQIAKLELQGAVRLKTSDEMLFGGIGNDTISWQGFKDIRFTLLTAPDLWYLFDYKTTKPKVDNCKNAQLGKPAGSWTWMKTPDQLRQDWQWNLYQWDEYINYGKLAPSRWVYWASADRPEARASDVLEPALESVRNVVIDLDAKARILRGYIRQFREGLRTADLPKNTANCSLFGGCPYSTQRGGSCEGETGVIPIGRLISAPGFVPVAFCTEQQHTGGTLNMSTIADQIKAQMQANAASAPGAAPVGTGAPGYPASAGAHLGAPVPNGGYPPGPPVGGFQPQQGQPGFNPSAAPAPAPGPYVPPQAQQAPAPAFAPPPPPVQQLAPIPQGTFGATGANPEYFQDGQGGWLRYDSLPAMVQAGDQRAAWLLQRLQNERAAHLEQQVSHVSPPEATAAPANQAPPPVPNAAPVAAPAGEAPKKRGRKSNAEREAAAAQSGASPAAAQSASASPALGTLKVRAVVTLENGCEVSAPISGELADAIAAYTLETALAGE